MLDNDMNNQVVTLAIGGSLENNQLQVLIEPMYLYRYSHSFLHSSKLQDFKGQYLKHSN